MRIRQIAAPSAEPVTLAEAKAHLRVDNDAEDALIAAWIEAARQQIEAYTGRALMPQDWEIWLDEFPLRHRRGGWVRDAEVVLPHAPLSSIISVKTADADGNETALAEGTDYQAVMPSGPQAEQGGIVPPAGACWPATTCGVAGAVRIRYRAGYASADAVPRPLWAAILLGVGDMFDNREQANGKNVTDNPAFARLVSPYKLWNI